MSITIAYLGPAGTYSEAATLAYADTLTKHFDRPCQPLPQQTIANALQTVARGEADLAIVPVENSIQGSVTVTLDLMWQLSDRMNEPAGGLTIRQAIVLPIEHALISPTPAPDELTAVYSHPQALAQCKNWLADRAPQAEARSTDSTADALRLLEAEPTAAAIASPRAAQLYNLPIVAHPINDYPDNCTRFWTVSQSDSPLPWPELPGSHHVSIAFSLPNNAPGALLDPLTTIASRGINMSRIESRPTKRLLGEYLFFIDCAIAAAERDDRPLWQAALNDLVAHTEVLKLFGTYDILDLSGIL
ncbi:MAG: prephenate dehydratase [Geitlerinemataceae cyanobacterium]